MTTPEAVRSHLQLQGFDCDLDPGIVANARWLRFTPTLSTVAIIAGTALRSPVVLWVFSLLTITGAAGWHLFDLVFNVFVRRWVHAPPLGPNPPPRRFAMAVAAVWSAVAGWLMSAGFVWAGVVAGAALAIAGGTVAVTHFCLGSWMYRILRRQSVAA